MAQVKFLCQLVLAVAASFGRSVRADHEAAKAERIPSFFYGFSSSCFFAILTILLLLGAGAMSEFFSQR